MKKSKWSIIILCAIVLIATFSVVSVLVDTQELRKTEIYREESPDKELTFILYQVGEPKWSFGPVKAQIVVCDAEGNTLDKMDFSVNNDGSALFERNVEEIRWYDTKVELDLKGADDASATTYVLEFLENKKQLDFGIENAYIVEQSEKVKLAENIYGEVFLLAENNDEENGKIATRHLAILVEDRKIVKTLSESYDGDITLCDFDGDEDVEIVLQETVGITGGYGHYLSRVFDLKNGELVELFSSEDETGELFDTGFSLALSGDYRFQIKNEFTGYNETFPFQGKSDEYYELLMQSRFLLVVDSFYEFVPQDVDGDGVYEIKGKQYTSLIGHADGIGVANTVLKYNKEKATFEVVDASFELE